VAAGAWAQRSGGPGNPQQLNRYSYVLNNPITGTDPSGHWTFSFGVTFSAALPGLPMSTGQVWSLSLGVVIDDKGNNAFYESHTSLPIDKGDLPGQGFAVPLTAVAASATGNAAVNFEAKTIDDVAGKGASAGFTIAQGGRAISADFTPSLNPDNSIGPKGVTLGFGVGEGAELHVAHTYTNLAGRNLPQRAYTFMEAQFTGFSKEVDQMARDYTGVPK